MLSHSFGLLVLGLEVFAQVAEASYSLGNSTGNASTSISETCLTKYGHASLKTILSSTHTDTIASTVYATVQSTPTVTFTPAPSSFTSTSTVFTTLTTTQSTATDTFTSTEISTETTTSVTTQIVTAYTTAYVTQTVQSSTSVAAAAGFTPLGSVYSVATKRKRSNRDRFEEESKPEEESDEDCTCVYEEEAPEPSTSEPTTTHKAITTQMPTTTHQITGAPKPTSTSSTSHIKLTCDESGKPGLDTQLYPTAVACEKTLLIVGTAIVTRVSNSTQTQTAIASSFYTTITAVESVTVTVAPADASTTVTEQSTQTSTATSTATTTTILTVTSVTTTVLPTATSYAQCQANNVISYINSNPVVEVDLTNGLLSAGSASTSTNCCIQCASSTKCGGFVYASGSCYLLNEGGQGTVCNGAVHSWSFVTSAGTTTSMIVGNGACGQGLWNGV